MKTVAWLLMGCLASSALPAQYYLRGEVRNERGLALEGVKVQLASSGSYPYYTGNLGSFGIPSPLLIDTISLSFPGYIPLKMAVDTRQMHTWVLKMLPGTAGIYQAKKLSVTKRLDPAYAGSSGSAGESYRSLAENDFVPTDRFPETGMALNIDKASYSNIRRFINNQMRVPVNAVRIEEMLNYFSFQGPSTNKQLFNLQTKITSCPWQPQNKLFFVQVHAPAIPLDSIPPSNLVFLVDVSGSMDKPTRLPLLQSAFKMLVDNLRAVDTISIMTYGGNVRIALQPTSGIEKKKIKAVIDSLSAGGDTPGAGAIQSAYRLAEESFIPKGNNRVILATDGDFNVGQSSEKELENLITQYRQTGIYLTCLGVGMGNYKDSKLEVLAKKGNGNFAYIDHIREAEKVLVTEFTQTLYAVANNASLYVNFNPNMVQSYRLIGFDNKKEAGIDSSLELEGGEIGSGHNLIAIFEWTPVARDDERLHQPFADITLRYQLPGNNKEMIKQQFVATHEPVELDKADPVYRFAAAVALFGSVLKQSAFTKNYSLEDVLAYAQLVTDTGNLQQKEFLTLIEKAIELYHPSKKNKKKKAGSY